MLRSAGSEQLDECETLEAVDSGNDNCYGASSHKFSGVKMQDRS